MLVLRNLAFYTAFYTASVLFVMAGALTLPFSGRGLQRVGNKWSAFHRCAVTRLLGIAVREEGPRPQGSVLYAFRHESMFEAIDLPNFLDRPVVFAKAELFKIPGWGQVGERYGLIPVARDKGATGLRAMLKAAQAYIATGRPLVIFPEGTRVPHGQEARLQAGFSALYKMLGLYVVPVAVDSGPVYHRWWKRRGTITMRFGEPIPPGLPRDEIEARVLAAINVLNRPEQA